MVGSCFSCLSPSLNHVLGISCGPGGWGRGGAGSFMWSLQEDIDNNAPAPYCSRSLASNSRRLAGPRMLSWGKLSIGMHVAASGGVVALFPLDITFRDLIEVMFNIMHLHVHKTAVHICASISAPSPCAQAFLCLHAS